MPRVKRNPRKGRRRGDGLSLLQRAYLVTGVGWDFLAGEREDWRRPFGSEKAAREAWEAYRGEIEAECGAGCTAWAKWKFEAGTHKLSRGRTGPLEGGTPRGGPVFPDAFQRGAWLLRDDLSWDVREHQWWSEYARPAWEHPWYLEAVRVARGLGSRFRGNDGRESLRDRGCPASRENTAGTRFGELAEPAVPPYSPSAGGAGRDAYPPGKVGDRNVPAPFDPVWIRTWSDVEAVKGGCWFDVVAAERACAFFRLLRHTKGEYAGEPFVLHPWQRFDVVMPLFGWKQADGRRRFSRAHIEIPKKNGKSTLCSGLSLYLLVADGEAGAEVYNVAADIKQANIVFREAERMAKGSPYLKGLLRLRPSVKHIAYDAMNAEYECLSSDVGTKEGMNISGLIFDELHAQRDRNLFDALIYGGEARRQPLFISITTAGTYNPTAIGWEEHELARRTLAGGAGPAENWSTFGYIRCCVEKGEEGREKGEGMGSGSAAQDCRPSGENTAEPRHEDVPWLDEYWWYRSNPGLGVTLDVASFRKKAVEAEAIPGKTNAFKRYRLNIWVQARESAFSIIQWDACAVYLEVEGFARQERLEALLAGRRCFGGLDLSATTDLTAAALWFPPVGEEDGHYLLTWFWLPEENIVDLGQRSRAPYTVWAEHGWLRLTPGNVVDLKTIRSDINELHTRFQPENWRYDPYRAVGLVTELTEEDNLPMVHFGQGFGWMNAPTSDLEVLIVSRKLRHCAHPAMDWQVGNCQFAVDAEQRKKIVKSRGNERFKVDGPVATVMARDGAMRYGGEKFETLTAESLVIGGG